VAVRVAPDDGVGVPNPIERAAEAGFRVDPGDQEACVAQKAGDVGLPGQPRRRETAVPEGVAVALWRAATGLSVGRLCTRAFDFVRQMPGGCSAPLRGEGVGVCAAGRNAVLRPRDAIGHAGDEAGEVRENFGFGNDRGMQHENNIGITRIFVKYISIVRYARPKSRIWRWPWV
jgi:hypothetical protein